MIGRKAYFRYGDKVMAVEVYAETPEAFKNRTGIDVTDPSVAEVANLVDYTGVVSEMRVGKSVERLRYAEGIADIVCRKRLMMAQRDIDDAVAKSTIPLDLKQFDEIDGIDAQHYSYLSGSFYFGKQDQEAGKQSFLGFMEIPTAKHGLLHGQTTFNAASVKLPDEREFVAVHVFKSDTFYFDQSNDNVENGEWIVLIYGVDNHSEGQRFKTEEDALAFVKLGWTMALGRSMLYYNS